MTAQPQNRYSVTVQKIEKFLSRFATFQDESVKLPIALWILCTFIFPDFDAFPYMVITSDTKRSGKSRLAELISFVCSNPIFSGALSPAAVYKTMAEEKPTLFFDEAEQLNNESANMMRSILNMGYRKGSVVRRVIGKEIQEYETYCPKVFILIGDVYDTLKDRSIIVYMKRGEPSERFVYTSQQAEGTELRQELHNMMETERFAIVQSFLEFQGIDFLSDRDEEIWTPLFVLCQQFCPERINELRRAAVDMCAEKQAESRRYTNLLDKGAEGKAQDDENARNVLRDLVKVCGNAKGISSADAVQKLRAIDIAPWRKFRGEGLTMNNLADMLVRFGVRPMPIRLGKYGKDQKVFRGYRLEDMKKALQQFKQ